VLASNLWFEVNLLLFPQGPDQAAAKERAGTAVSVKVLQNRELLSYLADKADCVL
jgi:hypothetical protein